MRRRAEARLWAVGSLFICRSSAYISCRCRRGRDHCPNATENVLAHLIIYDNRVIGGDIANTTLDGFMHGFEMPEGDATTQTSI